MVEQKQIRGAELRRAVLDATMRQIETVGIDQVRIAEVAAAAGVHETSIYRRWKTLPRLVADALVAYSTVEIPIPDTGSVRTDLTRFALALSRFVGTRLGAALVRSAVLQADDPEVIAARAEYWARRLAVAEQIVRRAKDRGEVTPETDPRLVVLALGGLIQMYDIQLGCGLSPEDLEKAVNMLVDGISPR
ncbi:TetR/AcrR family transcriptional regulator [Nocardia panacis]|uniref:TetR/AcrR family transcriptional regulator n=1 Tax=Nocardia panacis TaxID=2340916 RepID=A0A3A4L162_9NOCA|nr:TetR/AcrR family transcriptional regulator [Nocardia panacis]RJO75617.1 TetR/AcrR family transcriptional regulator [Nocardia panacis]